MRVIRHVKSWAKESSLDYILQDDDGKWWFVYLDGGRDPILNDHEYHLVVKRYVDKGIWIDDDDFSCWVRDVRKDAGL